MNDDILIMGTGGNALDVHDILSQQSYNIIGFLDDDTQKKDFLYGGSKVVGPLQAHTDYPDAKLVFAIGSYKNHAKRLEILDNLGLLINLERFPVIKHPTCTIAPSVKIGAGTIILSGTSIGANADIKTFVWCLQNSVISHDSSIGDGTLVACNSTISGKVTVGKECYLGAGCVIRDGVTIADRALVGMGASVINNIHKQGTYIGTPARLI